MQWYVYTYRREDGTVYYVGKGRDGRCYTPHNHPVVPPKERIVITFFNTEEEAWECERQLIAFWGRKGYEPYGVLLNDTLGGPGRLGSRTSAETKAKLSAAISGSNHPNYGKQLSAETRAKISAAKSGANNPFYGKKHTPETRAKISASLAETAAKLSKTYVVISPNGDSRVISNLRKFCRNHDLSQGHMTHVAQGKQKQHKGWRVRYA